MVSKRETASVDEIETSSRDFFRAPRLPDAPLGLLGKDGPLVGREGELSKMLDAISAPLEHSLIVVVGAQGTGKSRLLQEVVQRLPPKTLVVRCCAETGDGQLGTLRRLVRDRFSLTEFTSVEDRQEAVRREVQEVFGTQPITEVLHVLGGYLGLHFPDTPFLRGLATSPKEYGGLCQIVLRRFVQMDAQKGPVVFVVDDLQWADAATVESLGQLIHGLQDEEVTLIVGTRPERLHPTEWGDGIQEFWVEVPNLNDTQAAAMFRNLLDRCDHIPAVVVADAVEMTGGNPKYLQTLAHQFLVNGAIRTDVLPWTIAVDKALGTDLPVSAEAAIAARIGGLGKVELEVLEKGAVFGHVFWVGAIVALSRIESSYGAQVPELPAEYCWESDREEIRGRVERAVRRLVERGYLLQIPVEDSSVPGEIELVFSHNLARDLIARSTDPGSLQRNNLLGAQWLEGQWAVEAPMADGIASRSEEQLEFLAELYQRGGAHRRAAQYYVAVADRARGRYANEHAETMYRSGLSLLQEEDGILLIEVLHNFGSVLSFVGKTAEASRQFSRMLALAWRFDLRGKAGAAHNRLARIFRSLGEYELAMEHLRCAHRLFKSSQDARGIAGTLDDMGQVHWLRGAYAQALEFHRQALAIRQEIGDPRSVAVCLANIGRVHYDTGAFEVASQHFCEALGLRRSVADRAGEVMSLCDLGRVRCAEGDSDSAVKWYLDAKTIAVEIGDRFAQTAVLAGLGEVFLEKGAFGQATESLRAGMSVAQDLGDQSGVALCHRLLAQSNLALGEGEKALDNATAALAIGKDIGSRYHIGTAHRVLAEAIFHQGRAPEQLQLSQANFSRAVEILSSMHHELELARTCRSYAIHREHTGDLDRADALRSQSDEIFARLHTGIESSASDPTPADVQAQAQSHDDDPNTCCPQNRDPQGCAGSL